MKRKKIHEFDCIKIKNFCSEKDTIKRTKDKHKAGKKIFANHISNE